MDVARFLLEWFHLHFVSTVVSTWNAKWHAVASDLAMVFNCAQKGAPHAHMKAGIHGNQDSASARSATLV